MANSRFLSLSTFALIAGTDPNANMASISAGLVDYGVEAGLDRPHRLAQYIAQLAHETVRFRYDREIWDGKGAQARYDTRTDLGNTPEVDGDGYKYRGRTGIQVTGKANTRDFRDWCRVRFVDVPDFVEVPDMMNTDPWEGIAPIWYWHDRDLNKYADTGNNEMVTRRINGGLNGYSDRLDLYDRAALVLLGYEPTGVRPFQFDAGITVDGQSGPQTRRAMHEALLKLPSMVVAPASPQPTAPVAPVAPVAPDAADTFPSTDAEIIAAIRVLVSQPTTKGV